MKNKKLINYLLFCILILMVGCTNNNPAAGKGNVTFSVADYISKGIEPNISLDVAYYTIEATGPQNSTFTARIDIPKKHHTQKDITLGNWLFEATAFNADNIAIGSGYSIANILSGDNVVSITINQIEGQGTLKVILDGITASNDYTLHIYTAESGSTPIKSINFEEIEGILTAEVSLNCGYYSFEVTSTNSLVEIPEINSIRIVNGDVVTVTFDVVDSGSVNAKLKNSITPTPSLSLLLSAATVSSGNTITATAFASNINLDEIDYLWFIDNEKIEDSTSIIKISHASIDDGEHDLTCIIVDTSKGITWSDTKTIEAL